MNPLSALLGGHGAVLAAAVIVILSAGAAFLIYRAVKKGQRPGGDGARGASPLPTERQGDGRERSAESTEGSDDGVSEDCETDSSEVVILSTANHTHMPSDPSKEDLRQINPEKLVEATVKPAVILTFEGNTEQLEIHDNFKDHTKHEGGLWNAGDGITVTPNSFDSKYEDRPAEDEVKDTHDMLDNTQDIEESETDLHGDADEPSETESAQEALEAKNVSVHKSQSVEDLLDNTLLAQEDVIKPAEEDLKVSEPVTNLSSVSTSCLDVNDKSIKTNEVEDMIKGGEKNAGDLLTQANEFNSSYDDQSDLLIHNLESRKVEGMEDPAKCQQEFSSSISDLGNSLSIGIESLDARRYQSTDCDSFLTHPRQSYLGFTMPHLSGESAAQSQLPEVTKERTEVRADGSASVQVAKRRDKNEINIMEAIMDSNEWLGTGPPDTRDLPWLTPQTQGNSESSLKTIVGTVDPGTGPGPTSERSWPSPASANTSYELFVEDDRSYQEKTEAAKVTPEETVVSVPDNEEYLLNKKGDMVKELVPVIFRVHYITHSSSQFLAVTGNQHELGAWKTFVPLQSDMDGFWTGTITLPTETQLEWKFILVDDGKIRRWEECGNRHLVVSGQEEEEVRLHKFWGYM